MQVDYHHKHEHVPELRTKPGWQEVQALKADAVQVRQVLWHIFYKYYNSLNFENGALYLLYFIIVAYTQSSSPPINNHQRREIGNDAVWTLSSAKTGNGVEQLRDDITSTFWQSDGSQPHLINIQFMKKTRIQEISLFFDFKSD